MKKYKSIFDPRHIKKDKCPWNESELHLGVRHQF